MRKFASTFLLFLASGRALAADIPVTGCGQEIPGSAQAVLAQNLSCPSGPGVRLGNGASLNLNNFSLVGDTSAPAASGVECSLGCRVVGPGTIREFSGSGVEASGPLQLSALELVNNVATGAVASSLTVNDSLISGNGFGLLADLSASLRNVDVVGNGTGVVANKITIEDCDISDNDFDGLSACCGADASVVVRGSIIGGNGRDGIYSRQVMDGQYVSGRAKVFDSQVVENGGVGVVTDFARVENSSIDRNGTGIAADSRAVLRASSASDNDWFGLSAPRSRIDASALNGNGGCGADSSHMNARASQLENNGWSESCTNRCGDVCSALPPKLKDTTCGTSDGQFVGGDEVWIDWGVCELD